MNCIIIDDEAMARAIIAQMITIHPDLELAGEFENAIDAIKFLNQNATGVDLIFLDIHMPGFTGFDFIQTLKSTFIPPIRNLFKSIKDIFIFKKESINENQLDDNINLKKGEISQIQQVTKSNLIDINKIDAVILINSNVTKK